MQLHHAGYSRFNPGFRCKIMATVSTEVRRLCVIVAGRLPLFYCWFR